MSIIEDHSLTARQQSEVLRLVRAAGFVDANFQWDINQDVFRPISRIVYQGEGGRYFYAFETPNLQAKFCPGVDNPVETKTAPDWKAHVELVKRWLEELRFEVAHLKKIE